MNESWWVSTRTSVFVFSCNGIGTPAQKCEEICRNWGMREGEQNKDHWSPPNKTTIMDADHNPPSLPCSLYPIPKSSPPYKFPQDQPAPHKRNLNRTRKISQERYHQKDITRENHLYFFFRLFETVSMLTFRCFISTRIPSMSLLSPSTTPQTRYLDNNQWWRRWLRQKWTPLLCQQHHRRKDDSFTVYCIVLENTYKSDKPPLTEGQYQGRAVNSCEIWADSPQAIGSALAHANCPWKSWMMGTYLLKPNWLRRIMEEYFGCSGEF